MKAPFGKFLYDATGNTYGLTDGEYLSMEQYENVPVTSTFITP
jgi:hypothetical protein